MRQLSGFVRIVIEAGRSLAADDGRGGQFVYRLTKLIRTRRPMALGSGLQFLAAAPRAEGNSVDLMTLP